MTYRNFLFRKDTKNNKAGGGVIKPASRYYLLTKKHFMPFLINGEHAADAFKSIEPPKGAKFAVFKRLNFNGVQLTTSKGPLTKHTSSCGVPCDFVTLKDPLSPTHTDQVHVRYYTNKTTTMGLGNKPQEVYTPDSIDFTGESLKVNLKTGEGLELYRMMKVNPMMKEIGERIGKTMPVMYELYEPEKHAKEANKAISARNKAIALVYDEERVPDSLAAKIHKHILQLEPQAFSTPTAELIDTEGYDEMRLDLSNWATKNPAKFEKLVSDANLGLRAKIKEAQALGILKFSIVENQWLWEKTKDAKKNKVVLVVAPGEDEVAELIVYYTTEFTGKKLLEALNAELKAVEVPIGLL